MVYCNKCNKEFEIKIKTKKYPGGIEETYFRCPYCKERYTGFFTDNNIRIKQKKVRSISNELSRCINMGQRIVLLKELDKMKQDLKVDMDNLRKKMLGTQ